MVIQRREREIERERAHVGVVKAETRRALRVDVAVVGPHKLCVGSEGRCDPVWRRVCVHLHKHPQRQTLLLNQRKHLLERRKVEAAPHALHRAPIDPHFDGVEAQCADVAQIGGPCAALATRIARQCRRTHFPAAVPARNSHLVVHVHSASARQYSKKRKKEEACCCCTFHQSFFVKIPKTFLKS